MGLEEDALRQGLTRDMEAAKGIVAEIENLLAGKSVPKQVAEIIGERLKVARMLIAKIRVQSASLDNKLSAAIKECEEIIKKLKALAEPPYFMALFKKLSDIHDPLEKRRKKQGVEIRRAWLLLDGKEIIGSINAKLAETIRPGQFVLLNGKYAVIGTIPDEEARTISMLQEATVSAAIGDLIMVVDGKSNNVHSAVPADILKDALAAKPLAEGDRVALSGNIIVRILERPKTITDPENVRQATFADIGGLDEQIEELKDTLGISYEEDAYRKMRGGKRAKGAILYGPPGCGKTLLAAAIAHETGRHIQVINGSAIENKFVGEGPRAIREAFMACKKNPPAMMVIDEAESIFPVRGASISRDYTAAYIAQYNTIMDGIEELGDVWVFLLTNRIDQLDPAVIRPGRLDRKIEIPPPRTREAVMAILRTHFRNQPVLSDSGDREAAVQSLMRGITERLLVKDESTLLFTAFFERNDKDFFFKDFVSGALLAGIVGQLELRALKRLTREKIPADSPDFGIGPQDLEGLVEKILHTAVPREYRIMEQWLLNNGYPPPQDIRYHDKM